MRQGPALVDIPDLRRGRVTIQTQRVSEAFPRCSMSASLNLLFGVQANLLPVQSMQYSQFLYGEFDGTIAFNGHGSSDLSSMTRSITSAHSLDIMKNSTTSVIYSWRLEQCHEHEC